MAMWFHIVQFVSWMPMFLGTYHWRQNM